MPWVFLGCTLAKSMKELPLGSPLGIAWKNQSAAAFVASSSQLYRLSLFPPFRISLIPAAVTACMEGAPYSLIPYTPGWIRYCPAGSHALIVTVTVLAAARFRTGPLEAELTAPASILEVPRLAFVLAFWLLVFAAPAAAVVTAAATGAVVDLLLGSSGRLVSHAAVLLPSPTRFNATSYENFQTGSPLSLGFGRGAVRRFARLLRSCNQSQAQAQDAQAVTATVTESSSSVSGCTVTVTYSNSRVSGCTVTVTVTASWLRPRKDAQSEAKCCGGAKKDASIQHALLQGGCQGRC